MASSQSAALTPFVASSQSVRPNPLLASSQYGLGILQLKTTLDKPGHIHYGTETVVAGNLILRYLPKVRSRNVELFGPLDLEVIFQGVLKTASQNQFAQDVVKLFRQTAKVHEGPFRAAPEKDYAFPFAVAFPPAADSRETMTIAAIRGADGQVRFGKHLADATVEDLPPTLSSHLDKNDLNLMGPGFGSTCHIDVKYSISAKIHIPGLDVVVVNDSDTAVLYEQPKIPLGLVAGLFSHYHVDARVNAQDRSLIPESARPQDLKSKTKAFLSPMPPPRYVFDLGFSGVPRHLFAGQRVSFSVYIRERPGIGSVLTAPAIRLISWAVLLIAHTSYRKNAAAADSGVNLEVLMKKEGYYVTSSTFEKGQENSKLIEAGVLSHFPSSFAHSTLGRSYTLRIAIRLSVAKQIINHNQNFKVDVHPPCAEDDEPSDETILETLPDDDLADDEPPPAYEEVVAGSSSNSAMPPSWDELQNNAMPLQPS